MANFGPLLGVIGLQLPWDPGSMSVAGHAESCSILTPGRLHFAHWYFCFTSSRCHHFEDQFIQGSSTNLTKGVILARGKPISEYFYWRLSLFWPDRDLFLFFQVYLWIRMTVKSTFCSVLWNYMYWPLLCSALTFYTVIKCFFLLVDRYLPKVTARVKMSFVGLSSFRFMGQSGFLQ